MTWWESVLPPSLELPHNSQRNLLFIFLLPCCFQSSSPFADITTTAQSGVRRLLNEQGKKRKLETIEKDRCKWGGRKLTCEHVIQRGRARRNNDQHRNGRKAEQKERFEAYASSSDIYNVTGEDSERTQGCSQLPTTDFLLPMTKRQQQQSAVRIKPLGTMRQGRWRDCNTGALTHVLPKHA